MTCARSLKTHGFQSNLGQKGKMKFRWFWTHKVFKIGIDHATLQI
jgi:hypothetical protein